MAIVFVMRSFDLWDVILLVLYLAAYALVFLTGNNIKRENQNFNYPSTFNMIGLLNFVWILLANFLPYLSISSLTQSEFILGLSILIIQHVIAPNLVGLYTLGILLMMLGRKNRDYFGRDLQTSGIMYLVVSVIDMLRGGFFYYFLLIDEYGMLGFLSTISLGLWVIQIVAIAFLIKFSSAIKTNLLYLASILLLCVKVLQILPSFLPWLF
jgi:hypothetical protein